MRLLSSLLKGFIQRGWLRLFDPSGNLHEYGSGENGPTVTIRLNDPSLMWKLFVNPELYAAEAYMDGSLTLEDGSNIYDFLYLFSINRTGLASNPMQNVLRKGWRAVRRLQQSNDVKSAKKNARGHYDLSTDLYRLFLDEDMVYTCAYFRSPDDSLEKAQRDKLIHVAAKLKIEPGMSVVELGGGWGGFAILLAKMGANVTSLNVSTEQVAIARERAEAEGVADRVEFLVKDYREFTGSFDRVASIGILEHVGVGYYDDFFAKIRELLKPDGMAFVHSIGRMKPPGTTAPFIRKYIFPGGYVPSLSEVFSAIERQALWVDDNEILRLHYYYTIRHWRERFEANRDAAKEIYDERFCRMWEFYLVAVELGFLNGSNMVFQLVLSRERDAVPITRDYIYEDEARLQELYGLKDHS